MSEIVHKGPDLSPKSIGRYFATRIPTLFKLPGTDIKQLNPSDAIRAMSRKDWNYFMMGFMGWAIDSMDFFCVSACATAIAKTLHVTTTDITWGLTLVLMLRSVGALIFGYLGDTYGRKYPLIGCYSAFVALEIGTGFVTNFHQFLAVRALFGIFMGGCWSLAASTALEDAPMISRGFLSGLFLPGYSFGYLLAVIFWRAFEYTPHSWRALFWFSAAPPFLLILWRLPFPETKYFISFKKAQEEEKAVEDVKYAGVSKFKRFVATNQLLGFFKHEWLLFIFLILYMAGFNFLTHCSQDLFPTMLRNQVHLSEDAITVVMVVINIGGIVGGMFFGQLSEIVGRRLAVILSCIMTGALIYPSFFIHTDRSILAAGFFQQFSIMGAFGVSSVSLFELTAASPYRTMISGLAYQLGNLASSASSTIESTIGSQFPLPELGPNIYNYGKVMAIFLGCVCGYMILVCIFGFENFHAELATAEMKELEKEEKLEQGSAKRDTESSVEDKH